jgi:hypothetical protein
MRWIAVAAVIALAGCGTAEEGDAPAEELALDQGGTAGDAGQDVDDIEEVGELVADLSGVTPMEERVAVLGLLNKRNGTSREIRLRPGESTRVGDVMIRLRACERTAPWEPQRLTGAFVQLFVREASQRGDDGRWQRVFSGWLFKERPALNVVEHRLYDVWPKDCEMTYPESAPSSSVPNRASSAARSAPAESTNPVAPSEDNAASSNDA